MSMKLEDLVAQLSEFDNESLARITVEALEIMAKRGRSAWQALFEGLDSVEEKDEIQIYLGEWATTE